MHSFYQHVCFKGFLRHEALLSQITCTATKAISKPFLTGCTGIIVSGEKHKFEPFCAPFFLQRKEVHLFLLLLYQLSIPYCCISFTDFPGKIKRKAGFVSDSISLTPVLEIKSSADYTFLITGSCIHSISFLPQA